MIIDATLHPRSSLHVHNAQRFNHGQGFVIGHQRTNIVLNIKEGKIPLPPIHLWSKNECNRRGMPYETEHDRLKVYLEQLNLVALVGSYENHEVVVPTDSGYENKSPKNAIVSRVWDFLNGVKTSRAASSSNQPIGYRRIDDLIWATRKQSPWKIIRVETDGGKSEGNFPFANSRVTSRELPAK